VAVVLLALPWRMGRCIQEGKCHFRATCVNLDFPRGLVECARAIARFSSRTDIVQDSRNDEAFLVGGLSERRSYLVRPAIFELDKSPRVRHQVEVRKAQLEQLKAFTTRAQIAGFARQTRIRWYILHPDDTVGWPADFLDSPAYADRGFRVYDLKRTWTVASLEAARRE
jgi:hypothetical protein